MTSLTVSPTNGLANVITIPPRSMNSFATMDIRIVLPLPDAPVNRKPVF